MEGGEGPIPLHRQLLGLTAWTVAMLLICVVVGGISAALICLFNGAGFSDGYFPEKWRTVSMLFATFFLGQPAGDKLGNALVNRPRFPRALIWLGLVTAGTLAFAAIGPFAGKLLVNGNDGVYLIYALSFLLCALGQAGYIVCEAITKSRAGSKAQ